MGLAVKYTWRNGTRNLRGLPLPRGPRGLPIVGNLFQIPQVTPWLVYQDWARKYGDVTYAEAMNQPIVIINTLSAATRFLEKGSNCCDRLQLPAFDMMKTDWNFPLMDYGQDWRTHRRLFHKFLGPNSVSRYTPIVEEECLFLLRRLLAQPTEFPEMTLYYFGSILMRTSYGFEDFEYNKGLIRIAEAGLRGVSAAVVPGRMLVNNFPVLRYVPDWFPGTGWKRVCNEVALISHLALNKPFDEAKSRYNAGTANNKYPNMCTDVLDALGPETDSKRAEEERIARNTVAQAYTAGSDTSVSLGIVLFGALAKYPKVQERAQAELEAIIGTDRLPTGGDIANLPYIQALVKELNRWYSVLPMSFPRRSRDDDELDGYFIPGGTLILVNAWAIMHDPEVFEDPHEFRPERYLKDGKLDNSVLDPEAAAFGFGRRICPGRYLSNTSFTLLAASLLAVFDFGPADGEDGKPKQVEVVMGSNMIANPRPFEIKIKPRSGMHAALIS
ncbi:oxidoreductase A [Coprinopsis marcescibilis]|uniref:Oxidoreductase A n=1 Tax=Coprinopsis marcescibilis TaxID=230819 RepID=A0A5C3KER8_COPMA|nr:oxidoreductase A [Coprinopsis marcescibilis]